MAISKTGVCPTCGQSIVGAELLPAVSASVIKTIIDDLNLVLNKKPGKGFRYTTDITVNLIKKRIAEGFTVEDFFHVHRVMFQAWINDTKMVGNLNPETLYSNKFEKYLQREQAVGVTDRQKQQMINMQGAIDGLED